MYYDYDYDYNRVLFQSQLLLYVDRSRGSLTGACARGVFCMKKEDNSIVVYQRPANHCPGRSCKEPESCNVYALDHEIGTVYVYGKQKKGQTPSPCIKEKHNAQAPECFDPVRNPRWMHANFSLSSKTQRTSVKTGPRDISNEN